MTRDPFLRLALIAAATLYVLGLAAAARLLGWPAAAAAGVVGVLVAFALTVEFAPPAAAAPDRFARRRQPRDGTAGFERTQA